MIYINSLILTIMKRITQIITLIASITIILYACKGSKVTKTTQINNNELVIETDSCKLVTFDMVNQIIKDRCLKCHMGQYPKAGYNLEDKKIIVNAAESGKLSCVINAKDCIMMPPFGNGLDKKHIETIECWINNGMKD